MLADLRRRGFSDPAAAALLETLRDVFGIRLYEAIGDGGPLTLFVGGDQLYARTADGRLFNLDAPTQPLLMVGEDLTLRPVTGARAQAAHGAPARTDGLAKSERPSRGRRPAAE